MKEAYLIVREEIIEINDDERLSVLDGFYESPILKFEDDADMQEMLEALESRFKEEHGKLRAHSFEVVVLDKEETNNG